MGSETSALARLTPERREKAERVRAAMVEKFSTAERPFVLDDFRVILIGEEAAVVALTAESGIYMGSYTSIMFADDAEEFVISVGDERIDTRTAMTWDVYQGVVEDAQARGSELLPDSEALYGQDGQVWTATWLTGDPPGENGAHCGSVLRSGAGRTWYNRHGVWGSVRFRPAAVV